MGGRNRRRTAAIRAPRLRQLPAAEYAGENSRDLRGELPAASADQGALRSGELVPREPERPARDLARCRVAGGHAHTIALSFPKADIGERPLWVERGRCE